MSFLRCIFSKSLLRGLFSFSLGWLLVSPAFSETVPYFRETVRVLPVNRDTIFSSYPSERTGNSGGGTRLKLKGQQESVLLDIDPASLRGRTVRKAVLHMRSASPEWPLARVGVSSVATPWREGTAEAYRPQRGSACYAQAALDERDWGPPGGNAMDAAFGMGGTIWRFADATPPDADGWQSVPVAPEVVAVRVAGVSHGFLVWDEVGSEWSCRDGTFRYFQFPNRWIYSRESLKSGPWMEVFPGPEDCSPPEPVRRIQWDGRDIPTGDLRFRWATPADRGEAGTLGFDVRVRDGDDWRDVPRYRIPAAGPVGESATLVLDDLEFSPGSVHRLAVRPVDGAGNRGAWTETEFRVPESSAPVDLPTTAPEPFPAGDAELAVGGIRVTIRDALETVDPVSGRVLADFSPSNPLFSAGERRIRLHAARNETVAFQIVLTGRSPAADVVFRFDGPGNLVTALHEFAYVRAKDRRLPDPLRPVVGPVSVPAGPATGGTPSHRRHALIAEVHVRRDAAPGIRRGTLRIGSGGETLEIPVAIRIWNFALPDRLSFVPEMNAYGTVSPYRGYAHYRLAHAHRTCLNRLPSGWNGLPEFAPNWDGEDFDWTEWDRRLGPLLDGTVFSDLPRAGQPVDVLYLPFSENWPVGLFDHYRPSYWIEEALDDPYRTELARAFPAFARHLDAKGWHRTRFQFYLNNKVYHRERYPENSAPWIFDEPVNTQDFWALRWYARLFRESAVPASGRAELRFRADISYFQFGRNILWGFLDETYMGGANDQKIRMWEEMRRKWPDSALFEYGTPNAVGASNLQPVLWCLSAWANGADGVLPWQTIGRAESWETADPTALFYPGPDGPLPSIRLKAFRRGQQDVEYMVALARALGRDRSEIARWLRDRLSLDPTVEKAGETDAGTAVYGSVSPAHLWELRVRAGAFLSARGTRAVAASAGPRRPSGSPPPDLGLVSGGPEVETRKPDCENFTP